MNPPSLFSLKSRESIVTIVTSSVPSSRDLEKTSAEVLSESVTMPVTMRDDAAPIVTSAGDGPRAPIVTASSCIKPYEKRGGDDGDDGDDDFRVIPTCVCGSEPPARHRTPRIAAFRAAAACEKTRAKRAKTRFSDLCRERTSRPDGMPAR